MSYSIDSIGNALQCITSVTDQETKKQALQYLEHFQKSPEAWSLCHDILSSKDNQTTTEVQVFASQTLRNKVTYDLTQLGDQKNAFKTSLLELIVHHSQKLIVTQLSVALARLAIQYLEWRQPISEIIAALNPYPSKLLEFLKILPEETLDIKSTPLSEDEFRSRTHELIEQIAEDVLKFLVNVVDSLGSNSSNITVAQLLNCVNSWAYELPIEQVLAMNSLLSSVFQVLNRGPDEDPEAFETAVECLCTILRETRDVPNEDIIKALYEQLISLQMNLLPVERITDFEEYSDIMDGLTRLFVEAGEAWSVLVAKNPEIFKSLVSILLLLTCKNTDLDVVKYTFPFWFNLKQMLVLPRFKSEREASLQRYLSEPN